MQCAAERPERARHQARPRLHARLVVRTLGVAIRNKSGGHTHSESRLPVDAMSRTKDRTEPALRACLVT